MRREQNATLRVWFQQTTKKEWTREAPRNDGTRTQMTDDSKKENVEEQIDQNLRKVFQSKLDEEVPDRFMELLAQLKEKEDQGRSHGQ
jgi:hypothetical protein